MNEPIGVYLGIPSHTGQLDYRIVDAVGRFKAAFPVHAVRINLVSLLCFNFNTLLADALNHRSKGITHFLMLHSDVVPVEAGPRCWAERMLDELRAHKLSVLSAFVRIKNESGETSTATDDEKLLGEPRRIRMPGEPDTVTVRDFPRLLINTGLMLMDIRDSWAEKFSFRTEDTITRDPVSREFTARVFPEDWRMSRELKRWRIPFGATNKVRTLHIGAKAYA